MSGPSLDGVWAKYKRANFHLAAFENELDRVIGPAKRKEIPFDGEVERQDRFTTTFVWRLGTLPNIEDSDCGVILGDAFNNFRASLDHLAWIIVKQKGTPLSLIKNRKKREKAREGVKFPLAKSRKKFSRAMERSLPGIDPASPIGIVVARVQPYNSGTTAEALRGLRDLTNRDKHRLLISPFWHLHEFKVKFINPGWSLVHNEGLITSRRPVKSGTPIVRATFAPVSMNPSQVQLKGEGILYPRVSGLWNALALAVMVRRTVKEVIEEIEPLL